ncbi:hypothetical protein [Paenibacillus polymyxa]|uniref:hypothetical protein n=1 Tax=Paenibacillus TaxID=44249 RepID=UPI0020251F87|nr:hypothetical protein [Paenibacillus polymyxa]URJ42161.1 hypothetical protein MF627_001815 [Paenibacillus polymyxa]
MIDLILLIFLAVIFIVMFVTICVSEFLQYLWVKRHLLKPLKRYKSSVHDEFSYQLEKKTNTFVEYYNNYDPQSLENLKLEISIRQQRFSFKSQLTKYFTSGVLPIVSVGIAISSLYFKKGSDNLDLLFSADMLVALALVICFIIFIFYTCETFILNPLTDHLLIIDDVLAKKKKESS